MIKCMNVWFFSITVLEFFVVFSIRLSTLTIFIIYTWFYFIWPFLFSCYILFQVVCLLSILVERMATLFCCRLQLRKAEMKTSEHNKARQRNIQFQLESREPTFIFSLFLLWAVQTFFQLLGICTSQKSCDQSTSAHHGGGQPKLAADLA